MRYFTLLLFLLLFAGCKDDDDTRLSGTVPFELDFRAEFADRPLAVQRATYTYPGNAELKVLLFQYYISDLELLPADGGDPVQLSDVDLIRWMSATDEATAVRNYEVPAGDYRGLRFGLGVSPDLNAKNPSEFAADFTLNEAEFWGTQTRYVFAKIEANADLEKDGTFDTGLTYHMGSNALYTTVTFDQNFSLDGNGDPRFTVIADVFAALSGNGETFDIKDPAKQRVHGGNQAVAKSIWDRLAGQFTLERK